MAKTILITGGGSGIGRAVALKFASEGWRVAVADINAGGAAETVAMLPAGRARAFSLDVTDRAAWAATVAAVSDWTGGTLNVLHNNAGVGIGGPIDANSDEEVDTLIGVNLTGVINGIRACMPMLEATPNAVILNPGTDREVWQGGSYNRLEAGELLVNATGGGGGYGDPLERDFAAIAKDLRNEYISPEAAARDYRVVVTEDLRIDEAATAQLRAAG